jgi:hypothetical protein
MSKGIRISDDTTRVINKLGGTFDKPDDVIQRLIKESGHGELLEQDSDISTESNTGSTQTVNSASERKDQLLNQLRKQDNVEEIEKLRRSAWRVRTKADSRIIWIHYHVDFEFWGGSWNVNDQLSNQGNLIHVFLGPGEDQYYAVPDHGLHSGQFTVYDTEDDSQWKISTERGSPPNGEILEDAYTDLTLIYR